MLSMIYSLSLLKLVILMKSLDYQGRKKIKGKKERNQFNKKTKEYSKLHTMKERRKKQRRRKKKKTSMMTENFRNTILKKKMTE